MSESSFPITTFKYGLDTRKDVLSSVPGTLVTCENCHINPGGEVEGRKAFGDLAANTDVLDSPGGAQGTFGIEVTDAGLVVFGSARDYDEVYVTASGVASVSIKGAGAGATFNLTANTFGAITAAVVNAGGAGYAVGDILTLTTARGTEARLTVATLAATAVATVTITNNGNEQAEPFLASPLVGVTYQQLRHPTLVNDTTEDYNATYHRMTSCVFSENFNGKAFACALFTDGRRFLYGVEPDGTVVGLIQHSANGVVMENRIALADLANDLLRQAQSVGWAGLANRTEVILDSLTHVGALATATYTGHGLSNGDVIEVRGATTGAGVTIVTPYNGKFAVSGVVANVSFQYTMTADPAANADAASAKATILQNGSVLIDSPGSNFYTVVTEETATSGQVGFLPIANNIPGVSGTGSIACFEVTTNTGTFQLIAPESSDGTGSVDLCGGAVSVGSTATITATAIAAAVNELSFIHGYTASTNAAKVFVQSNPNWGLITFNLTLNYTGGADASSCVGVGNISAGVANTPHSTDIDITVFSKFPLSSAAAAPLIVGVSGGTPPYTFLWEEQFPGSATHFVILNPISQITGLQFSVPPPASPFPGYLGDQVGYFKVTVRDSVGSTPGVANATYTFRLF